MPYLNRLTQLKSIMNKIVIFDLDGTLLNSIDDLVLAANNTRKRFNLPPLPEDLVSSFVGDGIVKFVERLFQKESVEKEIETFKEEYILHIVDNTKPYDGIMDTVLNLKGNGYIVGILSNKTQNLTNLVLEMLNISYFFDFIYGGDSFSEKKPSPLPIIEILKNFNGDKGNSFMVGDSCNDVAAGKDAGLKTIGVTYGFQGAKLLDDCSPDFVAKSPEEIERIILIH